jgi:hypothetical protein
MSEHIYHIEDVAWHCGVAVDTVKGWLDMGLRHMPLGNAGVRQARDALIREAWLIDFLDAQAVVRPKARPDALPDRPTHQSLPCRYKPAKKAKLHNVLGPCPV